MASNKPQRWYEVVGDTAYIYDAPSPKDSMSVSVVPVADIAYYRVQPVQNLDKLWRGMKMFVLDSVDKVGPFFVQHPNDIVNVLCRFREYSEKTNISTFEDFRDPNKTIEVLWPRDDFSKWWFKNNADPGEVFIICVERTESGAYEKTGDFYRFRDLGWHWIGLR